MNLKNLSAAKKIPKLLKNKLVKISGFGTFEVIHTKQRIGRNPKTLEEYVIPSIQKVRFTLSPKLKKIIN